MSKIKQALKMADIALDSLVVIQALTKVGGDKAQHALAAIAAMVDTLQAGLDGKATAQVVEAELDKLLAGIVDNDTVADAALAAKFPA